jgi:hypothetical protein
MKLELLKRKPGRRSVRTTDNAKRICENIASGLPFYIACEAAGVSRSSGHDWKANDPGFNAQVEQAFAQFAQFHVGVIASAAKLGDWRASGWLLEHCQPEHFARNRGEARSATAVQVQIVLPQKEPVPSIPVQTINED